MFEKSIKNLGNGPVTLVIQRSIGEGNARIPAIVITMILGLCSSNVLATPHIAPWQLLSGELNVPRHALTGEAANGYLYAIGGVVRPSSPSDAQNAVSKYNPVSDSWSLVASMPTARHSLGSAVIGDYIYAVGGHVANSRSENQRYNVLTNTWESRTSKPTAVSGPGVAAFGGKVYTFGGNSYGSYQSVIEVYDPVANTWASPGNMPAAMEPSRATTLDNIIYVNNSGDLKELWAYDPVAGTWATSLPLMNVQRSAYELQAADGRIYAIGGSNTSDGFLSSVESWAPGELSWTMEPSLNIPRSPASAVIGNDIYVFGGYDGSDIGSTEVAPEPATLSLLAIGGVAMLRRKRK